MDAAAQDMPALATNLEVYRLLAGRIAEKLGANLPERSSVLIHVYPKENGWYLETGLYEGLRNRNLITVGSDSFDYVAEFHVQDSGIRYVNPRRDGVFGEKTVERKIDLNITGKLRRQHPESVVAFEEYREEQVDTISIGDIERVENPLIQVSRGSQESEGFFSTILEPVVLLGSIGVAVFLLFHVRS